MSVLYTVIPVPSPEEHEEVVSWLRSLGITYPRGEGRDPTLQELRFVLDHLEGYAVEYRTGSHSWDADIIESRPAPTDRDWAYLSVAAYSGDEAEPHSFYFNPGSPRVMIDVLRRLAGFCGPQLLIPDTGGPPLVVTPDLDTEAALTAWPG